MTAKPCANGWRSAAAKAVIPPRSNRKIQYDYDRAIYKQRNIIERMFCRFKDWRRIATRFDRNLKNFMAPSQSPLPLYGGSNESVLQCSSWMLREAK
jgi:hypothetical protein